MVVSILAGSKGARDKLHWKHRPRFIEKVQLDRTYVMECERVVMIFISSMI